MKGGRQYDIFPRTWKSRVLLALALVATPAVVIGSLLLLAPSDDTVDITIENRTGGEVSLIVDREAWGTVGSNSSKTFITYRFRWKGRRLVQVVDQTGRMVYSELLGADDLEGMDYRITVEEP